MHNSSDKQKNIMRLSTKANYTLAGIGFGLAFPIVAWTLDIIVTDLAFLPANIVQIHQANFLHYIVDLAPLVLGVVFYFLGEAYQQALDRNYFSSLSGAGLTDSTSTFNLVIPVAVVLLLALLGTAS